MGGVYRSHTRHRWHIHCRARPLPRQRGVWAPVYCTTHCTSNTQVAARFSGVLSREQVSDTTTKRKAARTGICGMRTKARDSAGCTHRCHMHATQGMRDGLQEEFWDLQDFDRLRLRLRCHDPVHFLFNLRTDNWVTGEDFNFDVFQAHIPIECVHTLARPTCSHTIIITILESARTPQQAQPRVAGGGRAV